MIFIDNINCLKQHFPSAWNAVKHIEGEVSENIRLEQTRNQSWTVSIQTETGWNYIHSKYDPIQEAERLVNSLEDLEQYQHVLFYGVGFGYHIEQFVKQFPNMSISIYEPKAEIFNKFLERFDLNKWHRTKQLQNVMVEADLEDAEHHLSMFTNLLDKQVRIVLLPSYERIFSEQTKRFVELFRKKVYDKADRLVTGRIFAKRMAINGIYNLPSMVQTPNILHGHSDLFKGKPALLVAAGPSLNDEYNNLRYIKENGLAYIFSVGSAVNALITEGIYPDAAFTYDGSAMNTKVFEKIINENIVDIPLVFGSTVGYETIQKYPGKMVNFHVEKDYIMDIFLKRKDEGTYKTIDRHRTVSTITLQLLSEMEFDPIILVGQNFGYRGEQYYAQGIEYINSELSEKQKEYSIQVLDVNENTILSSKGHTKMRQEMESFLKRVNSSEIINSTKGGANIEGTVFMPLEKVISERLTEKHVIDSEWVDGIKNGLEYDTDHLKKKAHEMLAMHNELEKILKRFTQLFDEMKGYISSGNLKQLDKAFTKFDKLFDRLQKNSFNLLIIQRMNHLEFQLILKMFEEIRFDSDLIFKANRAIGEFRNYLDRCREDMDVIKPLLEQMYEKVLGETITA